MYSDLYSLYLEFDRSSRGKNGFITIRCPFTDNHEHGDRTPSAGFSEESGVFNCFKCGTLSPTAFISKLLGISSQEADVIVRNFRKTAGLIEDFSIETKGYPGPIPRLNELYVESKKWYSYNEPLVREYCKSRGILPETLTQFDIGVLPAHLTHWKRQSIVFPYKLSGGIIGLRYRDDAANKGFETGSHFQLWGVDSITDECKLVVLVEGESDCLVTYQALSTENMVVVSAPSAGFIREWVREFESVEQIIVIPHADDSGVRTVNAVKEYFGGRATIVSLPWKRREYGNDICDWVRLRGEKELANLVKSRITPKHAKLLTGKELLTLTMGKESWLIKGLLARRQTCVILGQPKHFKTWVMFNIIRCLLRPGEGVFGIPDLTSEDQVVNILVVEEEGNLEELKERARMTLDGTAWVERVFWAHRLGFRLDEFNSLEKLEKMIDEHSIDVLMLDPLQRLHSQDENDAREMGRLWNSIASLLIRFDRLSIIILHHFRKAGNIYERWKSSRGSSRIAAEADLGIFVARRPKSEPLGVIIAFDGRSIPQLTAPDGKDEFRLVFDEGVLTLDTQQIMVSKHLALEAELEGRNSWTVRDAAKHFGVSDTTVRNWLLKLDRWILSRAGPGTPATIVRKR